MAELHGVETIELTQGTVAVSTIRTAVIGLVGTAPDAEAGAIASLQTGSALLDTLLLFSAKKPGVAGNKLLVNAVASKLNAEEPTALAAVADFQDGVLNIALGIDETGKVVSTAAELVTLVNGLATSDITAALPAGGTGLGIVAPFNEKLSGGSDEPYPLNVPVVVAGGISQAKKLGSAGSLPAALADIFDQEGALVVVVRADAGITEEAQRASIIAAVSALENSKSITTYQPRILVATGFTEDDAVAKALEATAAKLRGIAYIDSASMASVQDVVQRRSMFGTRAELLRPRVAQSSEDGAIIYRPYSACAAGLRARIDRQNGWWWSKSNQEIYNILGVEQVDSFSLNDANCTANLLNMDNVSTIMRSDGFRHWGNRLCTSDPQWRFESVRRTADVIEDSIEQTMLEYIDRPLDKQVADDIIGTINSYMRQLKGLGAIFGGKAWLDEELNTEESIASGVLYINYDFGPKSPLEHLVMQVRINNKYAVVELVA
ncbi:phage tail sheath C-terminal domain-containing protein [Dryocola clanedunensis]